MAKKPEIDFKTYCKVKHDGNEYEAIRALSRVFIEKSPSVAGLSDEGYSVVVSSMTLTQQSTLNEITKIALQENPQRLAEFIAYCEEVERERERYRQEGKIYGLHNDEKSNEIGFVIGLVFCVIFAVFMIIGIILGWFSIGYIVYVIADAIASVSLSAKIRRNFLSRRK